jgi:uncharacterized membrane protein YraQ (UPF0718 family)
LGNIIWVAYAIEVESLLMLINNIVTVVASAIIGGFMVNDMYKTWYNKKHGIVEFNELEEVDEEFELYKKNKTNQINRMNQNHDKNFDGSEEDINKLI